jgi:hypothetical protein
MSRSVTIIFAGLSVCLGTLVLSSVAQGQNYDPNMAQRMNQLEAETQSLRAELARLQEQ